MFILVQPLGNGLNKASSIGLEDKLYHFIYMLKSKEFVTTDWSQDYCYFSNIFLYAYGTKAKRQAGKIDSGQLV